MTRSRGDREPIAERLPDNLRLLYSAFSKEAIEGIFPGDSFEIDGVEFVCKYSPESTAERFHIVKPMKLVAEYRETCARFSGGVFFELGIAEGGSTALLALLARPSKLVAIELDSTPLGALQEFAHARGLADVVRPYYGVDQADRSRVAEILDAELGTTKIDVVVDDASHELTATRASFEVLFPRLRPGGIFIIEDWRKDHLMRDAVVQALKAARSNSVVRSQIHEVLAASKRGQLALPRAPLSQLAVELLLARAALGDAVAEVSVGEFRLVVTRGEGDLDDETFRVGDLFNDYFGFLPSNVVRD